MSEVAAGVERLLKVMHPAQDWSVSCWPAEPSIETEPVEEPTEVLPDRAMTVAEVAEMEDCSPETVRRAIRARARSPPASSTSTRSSPATASTSRRCARGATGGTVQPFNSLGRKPPASTSTGNSASE